ncbi:Poly(ADP-ribose) polymerase, catalytic domain-containing protein [Artemisia annua]|uniref:Poly(ADP-ribose) polymerase, catalytic domain-containing protein n=1 Tax=Artemisia annua TaxID=35608 RepID=A0A2U1M695_ARTAN|nr:Poly(ADP-ribose) polymerase, catalytic domain-containing protein [Artemisia annua]
MGSRNGYFLGSKLTGSGCKTMVAWILGKLFFMEFYRPIREKHLHQCIQGFPEGALRRIILTASGGAFSVESAIVDGDGVKHILLCRVLLGKTEVVNRFSTQCHPSSEEFDSGPQVNGVRLAKPVSPWIPIPDLIANLSKMLPPKSIKEITQYCHSYVEVLSGTGRLKDLKMLQVADALKHPNWSMGRKITVDSATLFNKMNTRVLPEFVISFKTQRIVNRPQVNGVRLAKPVSPWIPIPDLIANLSKMLPPKSIKEITQYCHSYVERKISRLDMIRGIREVGLPNVGKSTLFNKLSIPAENFPFCTIEPNEARVNIPDERFEWLCQLFKPKSEVSGLKKTACRINIKKINYFDSTY